MEESPLAVSILACPSFMGHLAIIYLISEAALKVLPCAAWHGCFILLRIKVSLNLGLGAAKNLIFE